MTDFLVYDLGLRRYAEALSFQREVAAQRISKAIPQDVLLVVEHPPVITLGRSSKEAHLLVTPEILAQRGVELFEVERGGDVTFHGPGSSSATRSSTSPSTHRTSTGTCGRWRRS